MLHLEAADYTLDVEPEEGGAVSRFEWRGEPLFRARCGDGPLNSACFPLVPFSNRIAFGRFEAGGRTIELAPNFPGEEHPHPPHGFGWQKSWVVQAGEAASTTLLYRHDVDAWPWPFESVQQLQLSKDGLRHTLMLRNLGDTAMPAGLGFHPYFPRTPRTSYFGLHRGEWESSDDGLPVRLRTVETPRDWWCGEPVETRAVDTVYVGRSGVLNISWPERGIALTIAPSPDLSFTTVYSPPDADFFCVEPVSHETDAVNRRHSKSGLRWLQPNEAWAVDVTYTAKRIKETGAGTPA